jgi:heme exporter protein C
VAYLAFVVTAVSSAAYLWKRTRSLTWDRIAGASAEIGVVFMALTLLAGALWGRLSWGTFWVWDARVTTTAFLFISYVGYLAVRGLGGSHQQRARRSAVVALLAVLEIPLVHFSVKLWRSVHQDASVADRTSDVTLDDAVHARARRSPSPSCSCGGCCTASVLRCSTLDDKGPIRRRAPS